MVSIRHVLAATDFSPASERALEQATELAATFDAKLTIVHVMEPPPYRYPIPPPAELCPPSMREPLDALVASVQKRWPRTEGQLREGTPWREIVAAATEGRADLIVVGTHGRRGLPHWILGSVAEGVLRASSAPVLTVCGSRFEDRAHAGRELARALGHLRASKPIVLALSAPGAVVAAEVARALGTSFDVLLTATLRYRGFAFGGICENGTIRPALDAAHGALDAEQCANVISSTRKELQDQVLMLRGTRWIQDAWRRTVILVDDELAEPWRALAAAHGALGKMDPDRIVIAAPVASESAVRTLQQEVGDVVVLHPVREGIDPAAAYRDFRTPRESEVAALLHAVPPAA